MGNTDIIHAPVAFDTSVLGDPSEGTNIDTLTSLDERDDNDNDGDDVQMDGTPITSP